MERIVQKDTDSRADLQRSAERGWTPFPALKWVRGGISQRVDGGMSWDSNAHDEVFNNRERYLAGAGVNIGLGVAGDQVHETHVHIAEMGDRGRGMQSPDSRISACDGLITFEPGIVLTTLHADCAPVFYAKEGARAIGLAHCGWRGTLKGLAGKMLRELGGDSLGERRSIQVSIGPMISTANYEFGARDAEAVALRFGETVLLHAGGKTYLDLYSAIVIDLLESGLHPSAIPPRPPCTFANGGYASFRRDGRPTRSMLAWIVREN